MKLFTSQQLKEWDTATVQEQNISFLDLMERAASACTNWLLNNTGTSSTFKIFCGPGNNGGDGLVIAQLLKQANKFVDVYTVEQSTSGAFNINRKKNEQTLSVKNITDENTFPSFQDTDVIVDCLFGTGLNRQIEGMTAKLIEYINASNTQVISIDIPSGMIIDSSSKNYCVLKAQTTLTFQNTKLCFLVAENAPFFGDVVLLNIGLSESFSQNTETIFQTIDQSLIASVYKKRKPFSHKGHFGHALLIAGSEGKTGAAILSAKACLRSGAGLLTCCLPKEQFGIMNIALPEAMTTDAEALNDVTKYNVIGIGPGLGRSAASQNLLNIIFENEIPTVADADALNMIAANNAISKLPLLPAGSVITPHPKEFDRLFGESANGFERIQKAIDFSKEYPVTVVLKDHHTLVTHNGKGYFNTNGNAGLAKGGSGDVLTGIITALIAQHYSAFEAAVLGVYLHGAAADAALKAQSEETMLATDVIEHLSVAFTSLQTRNDEVL